MRSHSSRGSAARRSARPIRSVPPALPAGGVLPHEHQLPCALQQAGVGLAQDLLRGGRVVGPLYPGDGAEGAQLVAAVGDLHVGIRRGRRWRRRAARSCRGAGAARSRKHAHQLLSRPARPRGRTRPVTSGMPCGQFVPIALDQTAHRRVSACRGTRPRRRGWRRWTPPWPLG